ncbi:MAG TPA: DUF2510 domain-containing protein [Streptosporangiaceae bacterium]
MAGNPAPAWYPDPENPAIMRWWDGARWSGETRSAAGAGSGSAGLPRGGQAFTGDTGPAPFGGMNFPDATVTGENYPGPSGSGAGRDPGGPGDAADEHASWREPAVQAWAAAYSAAEPATREDAFPVRAWLIGGAVAVVIVAVAAWFIVGLLGH